MCPLQQLDLFTSYPTTTATPHPNHQPRSQPSSTTSSSQPHNPNTKGLKQQMKCCSTVDKADKGCNLPGSYFIRADISGPRLTLHHHHRAILGHNRLSLMWRPAATKLQNIAILPQKPHPEALSADLDSIRWDECLSLGRGSTVKRITQNSPMRCPLSLSLTPCQLLWIHPYIPPYTVPQCVWRGGCISLSLF